MVSLSDVLRLAHAFRTRDRCGVDCGLARQLAVSRTTINMNFLWPEGTASVLARHGYIILIGVTLTSIILVFSDRPSLLKLLCGWSSMKQLTYMADSKQLFGSLTLRFNI